MKLDAILALRPAPGATAADLANALRHAASMRAEVADRLAVARRTRTDVLVANDEAIVQAGHDAELAQLALDRLDAVLPYLRVDLEVALGQKGLAELRGKHKEMLARCEVLLRWQADTYPLIAKLVSEGFAAEAAAQAAIEAFKADVIDAYSEPEMRMAGPLGVEMFVIQQPIPRQMFPNWK